MERILLIFLIVAVPNFCSAQSKDKPKFLNHYIGLQANQLLQQIINLNIDNTIIKNPYLLVYGVFSEKYKIGIQVGFGATFNRSRDNLSPVNQETKKNNIFWRVGLARNFILGKKWEAATGLDYVSSYQYNRSVNLSVIKTNTETDSTSSVTSSLSKRHGGQLQLRLGFHFSEHIMLTTESTFHYFVSHDKDNLLVSQSTINSSSPELNTYALTATNSDIENTNFDITPPVALFLTVKF